MSAAPRPLLASVLVAALALVAGCGDGDVPAGGLSGTVNGDGSSTVFPIMEAVAEEFQIANPRVRINIGESGTGGGFEKFCKGETDLSNASRRIKDEEAAACKKAGIAFTELQVASDGLSVVTNRELDLGCMTTEQLAELFRAGSDVKRFRDLDRDFPRDEAVLFTPGADSGTYDFFLEEILGKDGKFRSDEVTTSEDDNILVRGIQGSDGGIGFLGLAYYEENKDDLSVVEVDGGNGCVKPTPETVRDGTYTPLSRPLLVYVRTDRLAEPTMNAMLRYLLGPEGRLLIEEVGYVPLEDAAYDLLLAKIPA